jgi:hypothetical protein
VSESTHYAHRQQYQKDREQNRETIGSDMGCLIPSDQHRAGDQG